MTKQYLGDAVYVDFDGWHVVLTTENGRSVENTIFLEPSVLAALNDYVAELKVAADTDGALAAHEADEQTDAEESAHLRSLPSAEDSVL
mgnify:CR=1 FL=1